MTLPSSSLDELRQLVLRKGLDQKLQQFERLSTGIPHLDQALGGGIPQGAITEIETTLGGGSTSFCLQVASEATRTGQLVAWIDPLSNFDIPSAKALNTRLDHLLWVRPTTPKILFEALDILLENACFPLVVLDLLLTPKAQIPTSSWARIARRLREHPVSLIVLTSFSRAGALARTSLSLSSESQNLHFRVRRNRMGPLAQSIVVETCPQNSLLWKGPSDFD